MWMHSTGQGLRHSSQPVHSLAITACNCFAAPMMASTGQAWMHRVQPMHSWGSITAMALGFSAAAPSSGSGSRPRSSARAMTVVVPPGTHLLIGASPLAIASA